MLARLNFEFDPRKAASNLRKHGVSFAEAMTVFKDPLSATFPDELHSNDEDRVITVGLSSSRDCFSSRILKRMTRSDSSAHASRPQPRDKTMKKPQVDDLAPRPLDYSKAVRGKYVDRMQQGTNIVLLAPDLLDTFPDSDSVNEALRSLKKIAIRSAKPASIQRKAQSASQ